MGPEREKCEMPPTTMQSAWGLDEMLVVAGRQHDTTPQRIMGRDRSWKVSSARVEVWRELRARGWSFMRIGSTFGRDHTSVLQTLRNRDGRPRQ